MNAVSMNFRASISNVTHACRWLDPLFALCASRRLKKLFNDTLRRQGSRKKSPKGKIDEIRIISIIWRPESTKSRLSLLLSDYRIKS